MPLYENKTCPVCQKRFCQGDDVVFCPECGTPHHRGCYQQLNHCANAALHGTGFNFFEEEAADHTENIVEEAKAMLNTPPQNTGSDTETADGQPSGGFLPFGTPLLKAAYENDTDTIGGETVADVAATVRTNTPRFITIFKKQEKSGKKASWNWGAFFFGAYYFFYRKMFKQGLLLLLLNFAVSYAESFFLEKLAPLTASAINQYAEQMSAGKFGVNDIMAMNEALTANSDYKTFMLLQTLFLLLSLGIAVFFAVYADYMYKNSILQLIKRTKQRMEEEDELPLSAQIQGDDVRLTDDQLKRLYLAQRGGTAYLPALLAVFAWYFISNMLP